MVCRGEGRDTARVPAKPCGVVSHRHPYELYSLNSVKGVLWGII